MKKFVLWLLGLAAMPLRGIVRWLRVNDSLTPADVIFVHQGTQPFPALEAAALYAEGWAREIWIADVPQDRAARALRDLGVGGLQGHELETAVLEAAGVPAGAIRIIPCSGASTAREIQSLVGELGRRELRHPILVTVAIHSRRVRLLWNAVAGSCSAATVRCTRDDPFDLDSWWSESNSANAVAHELFGLLNAKLGFPLREARGATRPVYITSLPQEGDSVTRRRSVSARTGSGVPPSAPLPPHRPPVRPAER